MFPDIQPKDDKANSKIGILGFQYQKHGKGFSPSDLKQSNFEFSPGIYLFLYIFVKQEF